MSWMAIPIFLVTCMTGSVIQTVSGFGFGIFVMSIFPYFMPSYAGSLAVSTLLSLTSTVLVTYRYRKSIVWSRIWVPLVAFLITSTIVINLTNGKSDVLLKKMLGIVLIGMSLYFIFFGGKVKIKTNIRNSFLAGGCGGILGGMFGMGGPPMVVYLLSVSKDNDEYLATIQAYFALSNIYTTTLRIMNGTVNSVVLQYWLIGLVAVWLGMWIGTRVFAKLNPAVLKKVVYAFMAVSGVTMLLK